MCARAWAWRVALAAALPGSLSRGALLCFVAFLSWVGLGPASRLVRAPAQLGAVVPPFALFPSPFVLLAPAASCNMRRSLASGHLYLRMAHRFRNRGQRIRLVFAGSGLRSVGMRLHTGRWRSLRGSASSLRGACRALSGLAACARSFCSLPFLSLRRSASRRQFAGRGFGMCSHYPSRSLPCRVSWLASPARLLVRLWASP